LYDKLFWFCVQTAVKANQSKQNHLRANSSLW